MNFLRKIFGQKDDKYFVSGIDKFMEAFDASHPYLSASQIKEIKKYERIDYLRDHVVAEDPKKIWEGF